MVVQALKRLAAAVTLVLLLTASPAAAAEIGPRLTEQQAVERVLEAPKVAAWLDRYAEKPTTRATFENLTGTWLVHVDTERAGEVARGVVEDATGAVRETWTGPQVAWRMARGRPGAFGGRILNWWPVWLALSFVFVAGLVNWAKPLSLRSLDLLALTSFGISLFFFNRGQVFTSVPLAYPPLLYLSARLAWLGLRGRRVPKAERVLPVWLLAAVALFMVGFRVGLNVTSPRGVIDVGYAGVIGADRILDGQAPYGNMPQEAGLEPCGKADSEGRTRDRIQTNGRCESSNTHGDTYGPATYLAYVPAVLAFGWSGKWDSLPAAHATSIALDLIVFGLLFLVGRRLGGSRLGAILVFAWATYPFTAYGLRANTNDALMPALLLGGFLALHSGWARGASVAAAGWAKFASFAVVPVWLGYPTPFSRRQLVRFAAAFTVVSAAMLSMLLLEPALGRALRTFWDSTIGFQLERESPFSLWGWGQYHAAGIPDLAGVQRLLQAAVGAFALSLAFLPRLKGPIRLAALTAAMLFAVQAVLDHWFYLYLPWALPFAVLALVGPVAGADRRDR